MFREGDPGSEAAGLAGLRPPRRPLVGLAVFVVLGTCAGLVFPLPFLPTFTLALVCTALVPILPRRRAAAPLALALVAAAGLRADLAARSPSPRTLSRVMGDREEGVSVLGTVREDPLTRLSFSGEDQYVFSFRIEAVNRTGAWQRVRGRARCVVDAALLDRTPAYGDRWIMKGSLQPSPRESRLRSFHGEWLARNQASPLMQACIAGRRACAAALGRGLESYPTHHALLKALLLGYRDALPDDLRKAFSVTGTLHMFAISGLHVGVVCGLLVGLLNVVGVPRHRWVWFLAPALVAYTMATGLRPSAVRACAMALSYWLAAVVWRRPDGLSALALAAMAMLVWAPLQLLEPGFILSFAVVAGLLLLAPPVRGAFRAWVARDPWAPPDAPKNVAAYARAALAACLGMLGFSLVAWAASLPLTATFFNIFSPIAIVGNLLVVPAAFVVVLTGCLSILACPLSGFVAEVFNHANRVVIDLMLLFIDLMAAVPGGHRFVRAPHPGWVLAWYALLAAWALAAPLRRNRWRLGLVTAGTALAWGLAHAVPGPLEINVLDAGGGVVVHVDAGGKDHVLVNTGPAFQSYDLARHLRSRGVNRLAAVMLAHPGRDDAGGLASLLDTVPVDALWLPPGAVAPVHLPDELVVRPLVRGEGGFLRDGTGWEVLSPPARLAYPDAGPAAPVMKFGRDGLAAVYVCGWDPAKARELARAGVEARAPVLIWGDRAAPGTGGSDFEQFQPGWVLLSVKPFLTLADDYAPVLRHLEEMARVVRVDGHPGVALRSRPGSRAGASPDSISGTLNEVRRGPRRLCEHLHSYC